MNPNSEVAMGFRSFTCGQRKESIVRMLQKIVCVYTVQADELGRTKRTVNPTPLATWREAQEATKAGLTWKSAFSLTPHFATLYLDKNPNLYFW
jgi:hypothetical protein